MRNSPSLPIEPHDTYGSLRQLAERLGVNVRSDMIDGNLRGYYESWSNSIIIDRGQSYRAKRCTLVHELVHWSHGDVFHGTVIDDRLEHRTRRETALILVDENEYRMAELAYDGDISLMASELDVTRQVIEDYRDMVLAPLRDQCAEL